MSLTPEHAAFLFQFVQGSLEREHETTRRVFEAIPVDKADYRPEPLAKSAYELAWHIAAAENRFLSGAAAGEFDFTSPARPAGVTEIITWYEEQFQKNLAALKACSGEQLAKLVDFRGVFQMPAVAFVPFCINHGVHHRGQLSVYLRPMGGKVPAIYGESYDSAEAKKALANA